MHASAAAGLIVDRRDPQYYKALGTQYQDKNVLCLRTFFVLAVQPPPSMSHIILITGSSGYLGGSLLAQLGRTKLPPYQKLYALVRTEQQAEAVKNYGAEPLVLDLQDEGAVVKSIVDAQISIIYFLVDALKSTFQIPMIKALSEVKKQTGRDVHFLHTSGAKIFSEHAGFPKNQEISDTDQGLFELQKTLKVPHNLMALVRSPFSLLLSSLTQAPSIQLHKQQNPRRALQEHNILTQFRP
jgi:hypothetical protein